jgi:hypothetical protein
LQILDVSSDALNAEGRSVINMYEARALSGEEPDWIDFKWKLTAFSEIQDVFDSPLYPGRDSPLNQFHLWYFYHESSHLLTESILAGFAGLYACANAVLRIFLEFSVLQLYYYNIAFQNRSYARLEEYFKERRHPSWHHALQKAIPNDAFCRPIKSRLDVHFKGLSESASHSYHPQASPSSHRLAPGNASLEGIYFWANTRMVLQGVLWGYYVNFPMLFFPRNILRKFGFNSPVGVVVDEQCSVAVSKSLGETDYAHFLAYADRQEAAESIRPWIDSRPDLTDEQIRATWSDRDNGPMGEMREAYARIMAKMRAIRLTFAMDPVWAGEEEKRRFDADVSQIFSFDRWSKIYKNIGLHKKGGGESGGSK